MLSCAIVWWTASSDKTGRSLGRTLFVMRGCSFDQRVCSFVPKECSCGRRALDSSFVVGWARSHYAVAAPNSSFHDLVEAVTLRDVG
jgi:hypothetical protein